MLLETLIFQKTESGRREIVSRALALTNELRLVLVLIDGRRDVQALAQLSPRVRKSHDCLEELMALGLIDVFGESDAQNIGIGFSEIRAASQDQSTVPANAAYKAATSAREVANLSSHTTAQRPIVGTRVEERATSVQDISAAKSLLSSELLRLLGSDGQTAVNRVLQMRTRDELREALPKLVNLLVLYEFKSDAQRLNVRIGELLASP
jgi:hypothetical protein